MSAAAEPLQPLQCPHCGAFIALADTPELTCAYCKQPFEAPPRYRALFREHRLEAHVQRELEKRLQHLSRPPRRWADLVSFVLVLLLPALAAYLAMRNLPRFDPVMLFAAVIVPAALPGSALFAWSTAVHTTIVRFQLALACDAPERPGGPVRCRNCGAALCVEPGAYSARCLYCGTDSLLLDVTVIARRLHTQLRQELHTLEDAVAALRRRRRLLVGGIALSASVLVALSVAAFVTYALLLGSR